MAWRAPSGRLGHPMKIHANTLFILLLMLGGAGCRTRATPLQALEQQALADLEQAPESAGALVYEGTVFALSGDSDDALYRYQRRVHDVAGQRVATHLTIAPTGHTMLSLKATSSLDYDFVELEQINGQNGVTGRARMIDADHVEFATKRDGRVETRVESVDAPVVSGPTLFGWVRAHWAELGRGEAIVVRFATIERARTYAFVLRLELATAATTVISMVAKDPLVRTSIAPMRLVFDTASGNIIRYEGRVPPMIEDARGLAPLDARVEYAFAAPEYR